MKNRLIDLWLNSRKDRERVETILWERYQYDLALKFPFK